ncbi:uncharacterized protein LOC119732466 [Patiria miniata]|uniref:Uncharacterized protein n=1 Tax=Patiria miniata TaxID=46514 RepID=A0A914AEX9_PATMI|nr:uncharacterized protein LOC119732466 [Patiria miniata]
MYKVMMTVFLLTVLAVTPSVSWDNNCLSLRDHYLMKSIGRITKEDMQLGMAAVACESCYRQVCTLEQLKEAYYFKSKDGSFPGEPGWYNPRPGERASGNLGVAKVGPCYDYDDGHECAFDIEGVRAVRIYASGSINVGHALCCRRTTPLAGGRGSNEY